MYSFASVLLVSVLIVAGCTGVVTDNEIAGSENSKPLYTLMTESDLSRANEAVQVALETSASGTEKSWQNPVSGHSGSVTTIRTYKTKSGTYCRVYREDLSIGARTERYTDTACRDSAGFWRPIEAN